MEPIYASFSVGDAGRFEGIPPAQGYPPGAVLFEQGYAAEEVFHLERGLVKLLRGQPNGHEVIVGLRSAGWFLGASAVLLQEHHAVTAVAVTPCRAARVAEGEFRQLVRANGALSWRLHHMHSREVYDQLIQFADLGSLSARERLEHFLWALVPAPSSPSAGADVRFQLPLKHWEIAQLTAVTPQYLCQLLHELERHGTLRREAQGLVLTRPANGSPGVHSCR